MGAFLCCWCLQHICLQACQSTWNPFGHGTWKPTVSFSKLGSALSLGHFCVSAAPHEQALRSKTVSKQKTSMASALIPASRLLLCLNSCPDSLQWWILMNIVESVSQINPVLPSCFWSWFLITVMVTLTGIPTLQELLFWQAKTQLLAYLPNSSPPL